MSDGEGRTWRYAYGAFDVLQSIEDPGGGTLSFTYDGEGRVIAVTNQVGVTYRLIRDVAGRVIAEENFDGRRTEYLRDHGGRVVENIKPDGVRLVLCYDKTDKLTSIKSYAAGAAGADPPLDETYYWYDRRGLLIEASNQAALVEFERDGNGLIVREVTNGRVVESKRDPRGNRVERWIGRSEPGEGLVTIARDPLGLVAAIAVDRHAPLVFVRDALGRETSRASSKGFRLDQGWDAVGQLMYQRVGAGQAERRYGWDGSGVPTSIDDAIWGQTRYTYDHNGQVAKAEFGDGFTESFAYNPAKNVAGVALQGPGLDASVSKLLDWHSTPGGVVQLARGPNGEAIALTHDVCGRLIERRVDRKGFKPRTWRYGWDTHDRLVRCDNPEEEAWYYRYDPFGRRLTKVRRFSDRERAWISSKHPRLVSDTERGATLLWIWPEVPRGQTPHDTRAPLVGSHFLWDGDVVAEEAPLRLDGSADWRDATRWIYESDGFVPIARKRRDGSLDYVVADHLGTPREFFDEKEHLCWAANFTTWGTGSRSIAAEASRATYLQNSAATPAAESGCPLRFQGQWADEETGLYYNHRRHYDAFCAQYASVDPIGLGGGSRPFAYVLSPTNRVDPLGLGSKTFVHATDAPSASSISSEGVQPMSPRGQGSYSPGSFHAHELTGEDAKAGASHWAIRTSSETGEPPAIVVMQMKKSIYRDLERKGLVKTQQLQGLPGFPPETVFHPDSFPTLNGPGVSFTPVR